MWRLTLLSGIALLALVEGVCNNENEKNYYEELGCIPETKDGDDCPSSYDCSSLTQRSPDKCHYQGMQYDKDHKLESTPATSCLAECRCGSPYHPNATKLSFSCVNVECPELFGPPPPEGCYRTYEHGRCCHVEQICDDPAKSKTGEPICQYKNETYKVGQKFYPDEEPCLACICQPDYKGLFVEPFCRKVECNLELQNGHRISEGCVPVYYGEKGCCPIDWRCPAPTDAVVPAEGKSDSDSGKTCQFGSLTMKVGDKLTPSAERGEKTECTCRVPPYPVCVQEESH